jgi:hypothetical protein
VRDQPLNNGREGRGQCQTDDGPTAIAEDHGATVGEFVNERFRVTCLLRDRERGIVATGAA